MSEIRFLADSMLGTLTKWLRILGYDDDQRRAFADEIETYLASIDGVRDIDRDDKQGKEQIEIDLD